MIAFIKLSEGNFKRITSFMLAAVVCVLLSLPAKAEAGFIEDQLDKITGLVTTVGNVKTNLGGLITTISNAAGEIGNGKIQNLIADMRMMLQEAVNIQQEGVAAFIPLGTHCTLNDGTPCGNFRADLLYVIQALEALSNKLLSFHNFPALDLQIEDPGIGNIIEKLPGRVLLPLYKVLTKAKFFESGLMEVIEDIGAKLDDVKMVLFAEDLFPTKLEVCQFVDDKAFIFNLSANAIGGVGTILKILGKLFQAVGKTPAGGPNEVDVGIHGYVHATSKTNTLGTIGKILVGISEPLAWSSSFVSSKVSGCGDMVRDAEFKANQLLIINNQGFLITNQSSMITNQGSMITNQEFMINDLQSIIGDQQSLLLGQRRNLCAYKHNLPDQCAEFVGNGFGNRGKKGF